MTSPVPSAVPLNPFTANGGGASTMSGSQLPVGLGTNFKNSALDPAALAASANNNAAQYNHISDGIQQAMLARIAAQQAAQQQSTQASGNGTAPNGLGDGVYHYGPGQPSSNNQASNAPFIPGQGDLVKFLNAEASQESGGNYNARGLVQPNGDQALGKYQIMASNIPAWSREVLGHSITPQEYLSSPQLQEQIAQGKLTQYYNQFGPAGAAKAWYAGPGNANLNSNAPQYGGPSVNAYAAEVLRRAGL